MAFVRDEYFSYNSYSMYPPQGYDYFSARDAALPQVDPWTMTAGYKAWPHVEFKCAESSQQPAGDTLEELPDWAVPYLERMVERFPGLVEMLGQSLLLAEPQQVQEMLRGGNVCIEEEPELTKVRVFLPGGHAQGEACSESQRAPLLPVAEQLPWDADPLVEQFAILEELPFEQSGSVAVHSCDSTANSVGDAPRYLVQACGFDGLAPASPTFENLQVYVDSDFAAEMQAGEHTPEFYGESLPQHLLLEATSSCSSQAEDSPSFSGDCNTLLLPGVTRRCDSGLSAPAGTAGLVSSDDAAAKYLEEMRGYENELLGCRHTLSSQRTMKKEAEERRPQVTFGMNYLHLDIDSDGVEEDTESDDDAESDNLQLQREFCRPGAARASTGTTCFKSTILSTDCGGSICEDGSRSMESSGSQRASPTGSFGGMRASPTGSASPLKVRRGLSRSLSLNCGGASSGSPSSSRRGGRSPASSDSSSPERTIRLPSPQFAKPASGGASPSRSRMGSKLDSSHYPGSVSSFLLEQPAVQLLPPAKKFSKDSAGSDVSAKKASQKALPGAFATERTIIFFDWDDTLCPTSWIRSILKERIQDMQDWADYDPNDGVEDTHEWHHEIPAWFYHRMPDIPDLQSRLQELQEAVMEAISVAEKYGVVCIVTNAVESWVEKCIGKWLPLLRPYVMGHGFHPPIPIYYGQQVYKRTARADLPWVDDLGEHMWWKKEAMSEALSEADTLYRWRDPKNAEDSGEEPPQTSWCHSSNMKRVARVISTGDCEFEMQACDLACRDARPAIAGPSKTSPCSSPSGNSSATSPKPEGKPLLTRGRSKEQCKSQRPKSVTVKLRECPDIQQMINQLREFSEILPLLTETEDDVRVDLTSDLHEPRSGPSLWSETLGDDIGLRLRHAQDA
eukprot:TRINITY_DN693_c1_g1_i1.p1 TRINITY_DN693_c1_g1~~TRINITY_DN693_c1_g1_i1.p1  ORF type:complete len:904 (+),score=163.98 TRINITY_DN693_c1_g1_i1:56-2767(+)